MEERTYISEQEISCLYIQLEKCGVYTDAKKLLDAFVSDFIREQGGKVYDGGFDFDEHGNVVKVQYRNSTNLKDVRDEVANAVRRLANLVIREARMFDKYEKYGYPATEPATGKDMKKMWQKIEAASEKSMKEIEETAKRLGFSIKKQERFKYGADVFDMAKFLDLIKASSDRAEEIIEYIDKWKQASFPKINDGTPRLRPIDDKTVDIAHLIFVWLKEQKWISGDTKEETWNYVCGISDEEPTERIKWLVGNFEMALLINLFFMPFNEGKNIKEFFLHENVKYDFICGCFINPYGRIMKGTCISSEKTRTSKRMLKSKNIERGDAFEKYIKSLS